MSMSPTQDQMLALSGVFQACEMVDQLARTGHVSSDKLNIALSSLLAQNPDSTQAVFATEGSSANQNLAGGIEALTQLLRQKHKTRQPDILRYVLSVLHLQRKVLKNPAMLEKIGQGIEQATAQAAHFSIGHDNVIANLADLYQNTISTHRFRIQVSGDQNHLRQTSIANRIRCLLFAAVRSAILWHQLGGRRWQFFIFRGQMMGHLEELHRSS